MSEASESLRKAFSEGDTIRDAGLTTPEGIVRYDDIQYGEDSKWQVLDIYRPKNTSEFLPVIISVHGGGWVYGDKERYQFYCMDLAERGFAVVNFTYRLAPEFKFPSSLEDLNLVANFVLDTAGQYGFDIDRVFAVGDLAGAHLLGLYANLLTNPAYAAHYPFSAPAGFMFKAVALNCGCYQMEAERGTQTAALMEDLLPEKGTEEEYDKINVLKHMTSLFPPVYAMSATGDFLKDQLGLLQTELVKRDVPHIVHYFTAPNALGIRRGDLPKPALPQIPGMPTMPSGERVLGHVFHLNIRSSDAMWCNEEECAFFRQYC